MGELNGREYGEVGKVTGSVHGERDSNGPPSLDQTLHLRPLHPVEQLSPTRRILLEASLALSGCWSKEKHTLAKPVLVNIGEVVDALLSVVRDSHVQAEDRRSALMLLWRERALTLPVMCEEGRSSVAHLSLLALSYSSPTPTLAVLARIDRLRSNLPPYADGLQIPPPNLNGDFRGVKPMLSPFVSGRGAPSVGVNESSYEDYLRSSLSKDGLIILGAWLDFTSATGSRSKNLSKLVALQMSYFVRAISNRDFGSEVRASAASALAASISRFASEIRPWQINRLQEVRENRPSQIPDSTRNASFLADVDRIITGAVNAKRSHSWYENLGRVRKSSYSLFSLGICAAAMILADRALDSTDGAIHSNDWSDADREILRRLINEPLIYCLTVLASSSEPKHNRRTALALLESNWEWLEPAVKSVGSPEVGIVVISKMEQIRRLEHSEDPALEFGIMALLERLGALRLS